MTTSTIKNKLNLVRALLASNNENIHQSTIDFEKLKASNQPELSNINNHLLSSLVTSERSFERSHNSTLEYNKRCRNVNNFISPIFEPSDSNMYCREISRKDDDDDDDDDDDEVDRTKTSTSQKCYKTFASSCSETNSICCSSGNSSAATITNIHKSEDVLRSRALHRPIFSIFKDFKCPSSCKLGFNCQYTVTATAITEELRSFWGDPDIELTTTQRRRTIISKLISAYHRDAITGVVSFAFSVGTSVRQNLLICEKTYLHVIGHSRTNMWIQSSKKIQDVMTFGKFDTLDRKAGFIDVVLKAIQQTKDPSEMKSRTQFESCRQFITCFGEENGSKSPNEGEENLVILPFEKLAQLYEEYCFQCEKDNNFTNPASKSTFRKAYSDLKKRGEVRFARGKGTFPTCDICNNANDLLANSKANKMSTKIRELIVKLKQLHLKQQAGERAALEGKKRIALTSRDEHDNPTLAVIFGDGMTNYAARTPKYGRRAGKHDASTSFENRVFGLHVYCGNINGEILIHTDELIRGGANFMIEVQRRVLTELGNMLKDQGFIMPKEIHFQWDNCGENKNKSVFMFNSLLVELGYFEKITVGFLIIGHTHASIDQYFSCLRNLIRNAAFIASPLALQHLFSLESMYTASKKKKKFRPPILQIQLQYVHDYVAFFEPYKNNDITGYGTPYQFQFYSVLGKAVCQYKQFSDDRIWLPVPPTMKNNRDIKEVYKDAVTSIQDNLSLASEAGRSAFLKHLDIIPDEKSSSTIAKAFVENKNNINDKARDLQKALPDLEGIFIKGLQQQELRRADEEQGINHIQRYEADNIIGAQATLQMNSTKEYGYLIWIDYLSKTSTPPPIETVFPAPINPLEIWNGLATANSAATEIEKALVEAEFMANARAEQDKSFEDGSIYFEEAGNYGNKGSSDDSEDEFGKAVEVIAKIRQSKANAKKDKAELKKQKKKTVQKVYEGQYVVNAVAKIKAAATYMVEKKLANNILKYDGKSNTQLGSDAFRNKVVSLEDVKFFESRLTVESILDRVNEVISNAPKFQWLPESVLSKEQQTRRNERIAQHEEQYKQYSIIWKEHLCRAKERGGETVSRDNAELLLKRIRKEDSKPKSAMNTTTAEKPTKLTKTQEVVELKKQLAELKKSKGHQNGGEVPLSTKSSSSSKIVKKKRKTAEKKSVSDDDADSSYSDSLPLKKPTTTMTANDLAEHPSILETHSILVDTIIDAAQQGSSNIELSNDPQKEGNITNNEIDEATFVVAGPSLLYFSDEPDFLVGGTEDEVNFANKFIRALKRSAQQWLDSNKRNRKSEDPKITFITNFKETIKDQLNFATYKELYPSLPRIFQVKIRSELLVGDFSKSSTREKFLCELVDGFVETHCYSTTSSNSNTNEYFLGILNKLAHLNDIK